VRSALPSTQHAREVDSAFAELVDDGGEVEEVPAWSLPFLMCMKDEPEKSGVILNFKIQGLSTAASGLRSG